MSGSSTQHARAAVALVAFAAWSVGGLALADSPEEASQARGEPVVTEVPPLTRLTGAERLVPLSRFGTAFPVAGSVRYGQSGARFGADRGGRRHEGQDVFAVAGTPLVAVRPGVVVEAGEGGGRGNYVALYSPAARETYVYLHLQSPARVRPGQPVAAGQRVGEVGCTGSCSGDHLHFEVRTGRGTGGAPRDPLPFLVRLRS